MNPNAIHLLEKNLDKVNWCRISYNPNAISILEQHLDNVDWRALSSNPNAISLLEKNMNKIDWYNLSANPNAIHILEQNQDKIDWYELSRNPGMFVYDYDAIYKRIAPLKEELMSVVHHPQNGMCFRALGFDEDELLSHDPEARLKIRIPIPVEDVENVENVDNVEKET
jgi:hypothetical protein